MERDPFFLGSRKSPPGPSARRSRTGWASPGKSDGPGLGDGQVSLVFALAIAGFVAYLSATGKDTPEEIRVPRRHREREPHGVALGEPEPAPEEA